MYNVNWNVFNLKNQDCRNAFEKMCKHLFLRKFGISGYELKSNFNQAGLETEPIKFKGKLKGFQCKYIDKGGSIYSQLAESLFKAYDIYGKKLDEIYIYTNINIQPECSRKELDDKDKKSNRVEIQRRAEKLGIKLKWIKKEEFDEILNELGNLDIYRLFFSDQEEEKYLDSVISIEERTFLVSNDFFELKINGKKIGEIEKQILSNKLNILIGGPGTGKTETMKRLFVNAKNRFISSYSKPKNSKEIPLPIYIKLKECVNGNLEQIIRSRLNDFNIRLCGDQKRTYYFDGLDELHTADVERVYMTIDKLKKDNTTESVLISTRPNSVNYMYLWKNDSFKKYTLDEMDKNDVIEYFDNKKDESKKEKLLTFEKNNSQLLQEIKDIFSVKLFWDNIKELDYSTTKIDLIESWISTVVNRKSKLLALQLPERKSDNIFSILEQIAYQMKKNGGLNIKLKNLQIIISKKYSKLSYIEIDEIIYFISELFFDYSESNGENDVYSFKHRRFHEYFLYKYISKVFYKNPNILRELELYTDKDFILNIFLIQELKKSINCRNLLDYFQLRFFEVYLGSEYIKGYSYINDYNKNSKNLSLFKHGDTEFEGVEDFLCGKSVDELKNIIKNDSGLIRNIFNINNYWGFIRKYHISQNENINSFLKSELESPEKYSRLDITENFLEIAYYTCVINKKDYKEFFQESKIIRESYYDTEAKKALSSFFDIGLKFKYLDLLDIVEELNFKQIEILAYTLLKSHNIEYLYIEKYLSLRLKIKAAIETIEPTNYDINTTIVYFIFTKKILDRDMISKKFQKCCSYSSWDWVKSIECNSYVAILSNNIDKVQRQDFRLGIEIRKEINELSLEDKEIVLKKIIEKIRKYNYIVKNKFIHQNSVLIGVILARFDFNLASIKWFIREISKYESVISLEVVLYEIFSHNKDLFKSICNTRMLNRLLQSDKDLDYYQYLAERTVRFASMMAVFNKKTSDELFVSGLNSIIFRPSFSKEYVVSYDLPRCIFLGYENEWFDDDELEELIFRNYSLLKILASTVDRGSNTGSILFLINNCELCENLLDEFEDVEEIDLRDIRDAKRKYEKDIMYNDICDFYDYDKGNIDYHDKELWRKLIRLEMQNDDRLQLLFARLSRNHYPESGYSELNDVFHIITAVLMEDNHSKELLENLLFEYCGKGGFINMIETFACNGEGELGREYIKRLLVTIEALVLPKNIYKKHNGYQINQSNKVISLVKKSDISEWKEISENKWRSLGDDFTIIFKQVGEYPDETDWSRKYIKKEINVYQYEVYNQNQLLVKFEMAYVDGFRGFIPVPNEKMEISRLNYKLGCFLSRKNSMDDYISRSGIIVL